MKKFFLAIVLAVTVFGFSSGAEAGWFKKVCGGFRNVGHVVGEVVKNIVGSGKGGGGSTPSSVPTTYTPPTTHTPTISAPTPVPTSVVEVECDFGCSSTLKNCSNDCICNCDSWNCIDAQERRHDRMGRIMKSEGGNYGGITYYYYNCSTGALIQWFTPGITVNMDVYGNIVRDSLMLGSDNLGDPLFAPPSSSNSPPVFTTTYWGFFH